MKKTILIATVISIVFSSLLICRIPDFSLKKLNGEKFNIGDHLGSKIIVIDFWATWCKPCLKLLKKLNMLRGQFQDKILFIAISTDDSSAFSRIENLIKSRKYKFTLLLDPDSSVSSLFNPSSRIPFTMIIDKHGKIRYTHTGYIPGFERDLKKKLIQLSND